MKNKLDFVNDNIVKPLESNPIYRIWECVNSMAISWLLNSIHKDIVSSILYIDISYEIWNYLKYQFYPADGPHIYNLERAISNLKQGNNSIAKYFNILKGNWDELSQLDPTIEGVYNDKRHLCSF